MEHSGEQTTKAKTTVKSSRREDDFNNILITTDRMRITSSLEETK